MNDFILNGGDGFTMLQDGTRCYRRIVRDSCNACMCCLCRPFTPGWISNAQSGALQAETKLRGLREPTQDMVVGSFLGLEPVLSRSRVGIRGFVQKQLGLLEQPMDASRCCEASCRLGE